MGFDAKAYTGALKVPEVTLPDGSIHRGRLLSAFEYQDALEWAKKVEDTSADRTERQTMARKVYGLVFDDEVAKQLAELPAEAFWKAWAYFFTCQRLPEPGEAPKP